MAPLAAQYIRRTVVLTNVSSSVRDDVSDELVITLHFIGTIRTCLSRTKGIRS
ncbi:hypothetical protein M378DRAFT_168646 [Amanita muscaria Koide BX008]|uniref:Uncharacterized protein n=1 Tax=Amanita muscaria (strain Koide BX008) TaxID=946122 RepID=A0A0C2WF67_AMAMK|nr:hypothetical protein M378DRAFT_168646 [Amanita muscaria Koide BX008]